jgi:hypothetical protein
MSRGNVQPALVSLTGQSAGALDIDNGNERHVFAPTEEGASCKFTVPKKGVP